MTINQLLTFTLIIDLLKKKKKTELVTKKRVRDKRKKININCKNEIHSKEKKKEKNDIKKKIK